MTTEQNDDGYRTGTTEAVEVGTLIPLVLREKLRSASKKAGVNMREYLRAMIARELGYDGPLVLTKVRPAEEMPSAKNRVALPIGPTKTAVEFAPPDSVMDLISRGFSAQQVAAIHRTPYKEVLAQLGKQVDLLESNPQPARKLGRKGASSNSASANHATASVVSPVV
jgi:hypothetical protein